MRTAGKWLAGAVLALCLAGWGESQDAREAPLSAQQRAALKDRAELLTAANGAEAAGKWKEALAAREKALALTRAVYGAADPRVADALGPVAALHLRLEAWPAARAAWTEAADILTAARGAADWRTADARRALADVSLYEKLSPADRAAAWAAAAQIQKAETMYDAGRAAAGVAAAREAVAVHKRLFGPTHPVFADSLYTLGRCLSRTTDFAAAEQAFKEALDVRVQALGPNHPAVADCQEGLGTLFYRSGDLARALAPARRALDLRQKLLGETSDECQQSLNTVGSIYAGLGEYGKAEPLLRRSVELIGRQYGENDPVLALGLNNLADLHTRMGDYARAEPLYLRALKILKAEFGERHRAVAQMMNNLGVMYRKADQPEKAEQQLKRAVELRRELLGERDPAYVSSLNNLAMVYLRSKTPLRAEPLLKAALEANRRVYGADSPVVAVGLNNLGSMYQENGDYARAEPLLREALALRKRVLGEAHPDYAEALNNLAGMHAYAGDFRAAAPLYRDSLTIMFGVLDRSADAQTEQQQIDFARHTRHSLDIYLTATDGRSEPVAAVYALALKWKGQVFVRQRRQRELARAAGDPAVARLTAELLADTRQLATLSGLTPRPDQAEAWRKRVDELAARREKREADLAVASAEFRKQRARETVSPDQVRNLLPAKAALVDFFVYEHSKPGPSVSGGWKTEPRLVGFVVRPDRDVVRVELGPFAPIRTAVDTWRGRIKARLHPALGPDDPAVLLRDRVWLPLAKHLDGAETVLISPDADLSKLPFGALPGARENTYLIEERAVAVLPVPQFLPDLLEPPASADPSLLLVGEVDYGAEPGKPVSDETRRTARTADRGRSNPFGPLPATREEVVAIKDTFQRVYRRARVEELREGDATEEEVRKLLGTHRWAHLATHGFFAPADVASAGGRLPGLLSGLALAGANRPPDPQSDADDGVLTAAEVVTLDLRGAELVVLSACETGLGQVAGGEGVLGLQRAFQVAGARTVVASLWGVEDRATRDLMVKAYEYWLRGKKSRLDGLIGAQRWMLQEEGQRRGLTRSDEPPNTATPPRLPPYYWAAFVLSGDWR